MGADLYLSSVYEPNFAKHKKEFDHWVERRDALQQQGRQEAAAAAQQQVEAYYEKMFERGYFRDSYNSSNLLWLFDLSWWADIGEGLIDEEGKLCPADARRFLAMLAEREAVFETNLSQHKAWRTGHLRKYRLTSAASIRI